MIIEKLVNYNFDENTYILYNEENNEAIVIDPSIKYDKIKEKFSEIKIKYILLTHCHFDHVCRVDDIRKNSGAKLFCSKNCSENIKNPLINVSASMFGENLIIENADFITDENESFKICDINFKVINTPGHTNGGVCYLTQNNLFTGDTLFLRSVGRWDLPTGSFDELNNSVKNVLFKLDENIQVYPGHGDKTTIGYEKKFNLVIN